MSAVSMPMRSSRCRMRSFWSIVGARTDGDCRPSRSVSSLSCTTRRLRRRRLEVPVEDQVIHDGTSSLRLQAASRSVRLQADPSEHERADQPRHGNAAAPPQAVTNRCSVGWTHHLIDGDLRPAAGVAVSRRGSLRRDVAAHARTRPAILRDTERDHRRKDDQACEASHISIIGPLSRNHAAATMTTIDHDDDDRPPRPATVLEDRPLGRRLDLRLGRRAPAAVTDERVVGNFCLAELAVHVRTQASGSTVSVSGFRNQTVMYY